MSSKEKMEIAEKRELPNLTFDVSYFADEVREGFYISSMMKRYWAAQLTVLKEIDRVCRRYDIPWFADCGTLLGAVRHGGYVPWDDDLDICMLRHDWIRFFEAAKDEMPEGYCILNLQNEMEYEQLIGRIVNSHAINYSAAHMKEFHGCPYTVGIDIYPLDGLSEDEEQEEKRRRRAASVTEAMKLINTGQMDTPECRRVLTDIERQNHTTLHGKGNIRRELLLLAEKIYTMYSSEHGENVALMPFWISDHNHKYSKELFRNALLLPFENTYIPVPARYDEVLHIEYGDYMAIHKGGGLHEYPVYKKQEEILGKSWGENPYRYTLSTNTRLPIRTAKPLIEKCDEMIEILTKAHAQIRTLPGNDSHGAAVQLLEGCQGLAISLGTLIENRIGNRAPVIPLLEEYCELVYQCGENGTAENVAALEESIGKIRGELTEIMEARHKEVLFLPCKKSWWAGMEPAYRRALAQPDTDVYVIAVPYQEGDRLTLTEGREYNDGSLLPKDVVLTLPEEYDIAKHHPDVIYTHYPYDHLGTTMDIPRFFYSANLREHTDKLVYLPPYICDAPIDADDRAATAMEVLIEQPAAVNADEIELTSEELKNLYIDTLTSLAGSREYWEEKVKVRKSEPETICSGGEEKECPADWKARSVNRKILVFRLSIPYLLQYGERAIEKLREAIRVIEQASDSIVCVFSPDEGVTKLEEIDKRLWEHFMGFVNEIKTGGLVIYDEEHAADKNIGAVSAYYGCPGNLAHRCRNQGIPVMLMSAPT